MRRAVRALAVLAILGVAAGPATGETSIEARVWEAAGVTPIRPVRIPLTLPDTAGHSVSLADFHGRVVMLYFWTTW